MLKQIKEILDIKSVLDIGCDYCDMSNDLESYIGIDTNNTKIKKLRNDNFNKKNKIFITIDPVKEFLPKTDLVIMPKSRVYSNTRNTWLLLEKIRQSEPKYFLSPIKLSKAPFYIPKANFAVIDSNDKLFYLYFMDNVAFYLEECAENIALLRKTLIPILEKHLNKIYNTFLKYDNGKEMFFEKLVNDKELSWQKQYYDEDIKKIVDDGIFDEYIDLLTLKYNQSLDDLKNSYDKCLNEENFIWAGTMARSYINFYAKHLE